MRNHATVDDIGNVLTELELLWRTHPHQRLGQLLLNLTRNEAGKTDKHTLWNADEATLQARIVAAIKAGTVSP